MNLQAHETTRALASTAENRFYTLIGSRGYAAEDEAQQPTAAGSMGSSGSIGSEGPVHEVQRVRAPPQFPLLVLKFPVTVHATMSGQDMRNVATAVAVAGALVTTVVRAEQGATITSTSDKRFEVASVRPTRDLTSGTWATTPGQFVRRNVSVKELIALVSRSAQTASWAPRNCWRSVMMWSPRRYQPGLQTICATWCATSW